MLHLISTDELMKTAWINFILHLEGRIYGNRQGLLISGPLKSLWLIVRILIFEFILNLVSLPLYLVEKHPSGKFKHFKTRRVITLWIVSIIGIIWVVKLTLAALFLILFSQSQQYQVQNVSQVNQELSSEMIFQTEQAMTSDKLKTPQITSAKAFPNGNLNISGKASPGAWVVVYLSEVEQKDKNMGVGVFPAESDKNGNFSITPNIKQFKLPKGKYLVQATSYESRGNIKSLPSSMFSFEIPFSPAYIEDNVRTMDQGLNLLIMTFLGGGLLLTLLLT